MLRDYQQEAHDAIVEWIRKSKEPCLIEGVTACGKSHIIAAVANTIHSLTGKHVLALQPSAELVEQNREKYLATGNPASIFSASAGGKCLKYPVVFGTPGTVKNSIDKFGGKISLILIDECHGITPTIKGIIERIKEVNPNVRVVGFSGSPYRLGTGYIYKMDEHGKPTGEKAKDPYFTAKVYTITAHRLLGRGYLTPPRVGTTGQNYETLHLEVNKMGKFDSADVDKAFTGHGRLTSEIVAEVVHNSRDRKGVMLFAATVQHAEEVLDSLPPSLSRMLDGKTKRKERRELIKLYKKKGFKYFVSVGTLTTGFDAPHVDHIVLLRATESPALLQQIIGRGLRIDDGKADCLISDYGQNLERHCPDGDIFNPEIKVSFGGESAGLVTATCEECSTENEFSARKNEEGYEYDEQGYFVDLDGNRIESEFGPIPSHHGRRCQGLQRAFGGEYRQCGYRWTSKKCPACAEPNDIAARYCAHCKAEIIDPNEKLHMEFKRFKRDPTKVQTDKVIDWEVRDTLSQKGNKTIRVNWVTEYRKFSTWYQPDAEKGRMFADCDQIKLVTKEWQTMPETITYQKNAENGFYRIHTFNEEADEVPQVA